MLPPAAAAAGGRAGVVVGGLTLVIAADGIEGAPEGVDCGGLDMEPLLCIEAISA